MQLNHEKCFCHLQHKKCFVVMRLDYLVGRNIGDFYQTNFIVRLTSAKIRKISIYFFCFLKST